VEASDVLLEVLDARDPAGYRVKELEQSLLEMGKKVVIVLNKADLVPRSVLEGWIKVIQREYPCLAFKAQGSTYAKNINNESLLASGDDIVQLLKNYSRSKDIKTAITVGVIGYPNVGKSSLINALKRSKVCKVGATPGVTTSGQEVHLDKNIRLIDCPGVVFGSKDNESLVNCIKVEQLSDPTEPVRKIVEKCPPEYLAQLYSISAFSNVDEFIQLCGQRLGKLKKGGVVDVEVTAKIILQDWNSGKIRYYVEPPALVDAGTVIVDTLAPEFRVEGKVGVVSGREDIGMDLVGNLVIGQISTKQDTKTIQKDASMSTFEQSLNPQTNKLRQLALKKQKKQQLRVQSRTAPKQNNSTVEDDESDADMSEAFSTFKPLPQ
jgi:nuclear GTP-binding protein